VVLSQSKVVHGGIVTITCSSWGNMQIFGQSI
jgi:hypothetical protein